MARRPSRPKATTRSSRRASPKRAKTAQARGRRARAADLDLGLVVHKLGIDQAPASIGAKTAKTVIYIHGIGNKPPASVLKCQWDLGLFGTQRGDGRRMAGGVIQAR